MRTGKNTPFRSLLLAILALASLAPAVVVEAEPATAYWELPIPAQGEDPAWSTADIFGLNPNLCGLCHPAQYQGWQHSLHALAFSEGVAGQLDAFDEETVDDCLGCHAPRTEQQLRWKEEGITSLSDQHGVDCAACHLRHQWRYGPRDLPLTPHGPVTRHPLFGEAEFCSPCHQFDAEGLSVNGKPLENTYIEWRDSRYAREGVTCQSCHMPKRAHTFKGIHDPATTRKGLGVRVSRTAAGVELVAANTGAGHALPTYVTPSLTLHIASTADPARQTQHVIRRHMQWDEEKGWRELSDTRLLPGSSVRLNLALEKDETAIASVLVEPDADYHDRVYPALLELLADELSASAIALLERARDRSGRSRYILYRFECPAWSGADAICTEVR